MDGMSLFIIGCIAVGAALLGLWAYGRRSVRMDAGTREHTAAIQAQQWGVRIHAPARERACPHVRELLEKEFALDTKPPLPLPDCPFPDQCACSYVKLFDRRRQSRRTREARRQAGERIEAGKLPRRSGQDRRGNRADWF